MHTSSTGLAAIGPILELAPDVVVLDLGLPDIDGADLLRMLRGVSAVPVIIATARDDEREIVRLLDAGADDYVVKPFSADQLEARLRAVLRRASSAAGERAIQVGGIAIDTAARTVALDGVPLELTRMEYDLLTHLGCGVPGGTGRWRGCGGARVRARRRAARWGDLCVAHTHCRGYRARYRLGLVG